MTLRLSFVGDGPRDHATVPPLVAAALGAEVEVAAAHPWSRLSGGGYARKLAFAVRQALDEESQGLVVTVDQDRDAPRKRLRVLIEGREAVRSKPGRAALLPTALGEARPHAEAWLLDDAEAVRGGLGFEPGRHVKTVRDTKSPKDELDLLLGDVLADEERAIDCLVRIARGVQADRCQHAKETGFEAFVEELRRELGPLRRSRP